MSWTELFLLSEGIERPDEAYDWLDLADLTDRVGTSWNRRGVFDVNKSYKHYDTVWGKSRARRESISEKQMGLRVERIVRQAHFAENKFKRRHILLKGINLVMIHGDGSANGHALPSKSGAIVWVAAECFHTALETKVFVTHEIAHGIHYREEPGFAFHTMEEKRLVWRQLITEGVATYLTKKALKVPDEIALWADTLPPDQLRSWMEACRNRERELFEYIERNFDSSDPSISLFYAADPNDIFAYRAGYYAGLKLIEKVCKENKIRDWDLPTISVDMLRGYVRSAFRNWNYVDNLQT